MRREVAAAVGGDGSCGAASGRNEEAPSAAAAPPSFRQITPPPPSVALGQAAGRGRGRRGLLRHPGRGARGGLLDRFRGRDEDGVDQVDNGGARRHVGGGDLGDRARVALHGNDARLGEVDGEVGPGEPRLDDGAVGELGGLFFLFFREVGVAVRKNKERKKHWTPRRLSCGALAAAPPVAAWERERGRGKKGHARASDDGVAAPPKPETKNAFSFPLSLPSLSIPPLSP